jgi:hypothetical protein
MIRKHSSTYCPVCGYDLGFEAWRGSSASDEICPSCGIQFGYDDATGGDIRARAAVYRRWRQEWKEQGMPWRSKGRRPPVDWNPIHQLRSNDALK